MGHWALRPSSALTWWAVRCRVLECEGGGLVGDVQGHSISRGLLYVGVEKQILSASRVIQADVNKCLTSEQPCVRSTQRLWVHKRLASAQGVLSPPSGPTAFPEEGSKVGQQAGPGGRVMGSGLARKHQTPGSPTDPFLWFLTLRGRDCVTCRIKLGEDWFFRFAGLELVRNE